MKKRKVSALNIAIAVVLIGAVVGIGLFARLLALRTSFKHDRRDLTACFTNVYHGGMCQANRQGEFVEDAAQFADWVLYNFMTQDQTVPIRKEIMKSDTPQTITVSMQEASIYLSPAQTPYYTNVTWKIGENWYGYTVSGALPFAHVERAFENALRNQERSR